MFSANIETRFGYIPDLEYIFESRIICEMGILRIACTILPPHTKIRLILVQRNTGIKPVSFQCESR